MANDSRTPGPECAVLTSHGTVYLYRLTSADLRAFRELPGTTLSSDKFRALLGRIGSLHVSEKGILDAGALTADDIESLGDDEIERIAESYLESTTLRWYRHEGASATLSVIRNPAEPATQFVDRLVNWYATRGPGSKSPEGDARSSTGQYPRPRLVPADMIVLSKREAWVALAALGLLGVLGIGAFLQHYLLVHSLQQQQEALITQVKETNALLAQHVSRASEENAELRRRLEALETHLRTPPPGAAKAATPKSAAKATAAATKPATKKGKTRR